jgi:hypothetical protein
MKTYWGSGGVAPRILDLGARWRWVVSFTPQPLKPQGKSPWYQLVRRLGGTLNSSGHGGEEKNSQPSPGIEPWNFDGPAPSPALYRLNYPGSTELHWQKVCYKFSMKRFNERIALGFGLDDQGSRVRFPAGAGNFSLHHRCIQNGSGAHPASYPMGTRGSFPAGKAAGAWSWPLTFI